MGGFFLVFLGFAAKYTKMFVLVCRTIVWLSKTAHEICMHTPYWHPWSFSVGEGGGRGVYWVAKKIGDEKANGGPKAPPNMGWLYGWTLMYEFFFPSWC